MGKKVFFGHGRSHLWRELKDLVVDRLHLDWDEFNRESAAGLPTTQRLRAMLDNAAFAFLVMTAEDEHADGSLHARENVVHEVGLFQGKLGFERAIIIMEEGCTEFSNIHGLTQIRFPKGKISAVFEEVRKVLEREDVFNHKSPSFSQTHVNAAGSAPPGEKKAVPIFLAPRFTWLQFDSENDNPVWHMSTEKSRIGGVVLPIYNDPNKSDVEIEYARVHLTFTDGATKETHVIGDGWWIDEEYEDTELRLGDQKYIILIVLGDKNDANPCAIANTARTYKNGTLHYNSIVMRDIPLNGKIYDVEACLIHGGSSQFKNVNRFTLALSEFKRS